MLHVNVTTRNTKCYNMVGHAGGSGVYPKFDGACKVAEGVWSGWDEMKLGDWRRWQGNFSIKVAPHTSSMPTRWGP